MHCKGEEPKTETSRSNGGRLDAFGPIESTSGTCATWYSAYQDALSSKQSEQSENIEVFYPESAQTVSDGLIHSRVIFALFADLDIDDTHIGVRVEKGLVILGGLVREARQKIRAGNVVKRQKGVTAVRNNLQVASRHLDHSIAENVKAVLESFTLIDTHAVDVSVDRGIVMLNGMVPNQNAREVAGRVAWRTPGVLDVRNHLTVVANG